MSIIFVVGASYTGSSAVVDYLNDLSGVDCVMPNRNETRFFSGLGGFSDLIKKPTGRDGLVNFDLDKVCGLLLGTEGSEFDRKRNSAVRKYYGIDYENCIHDVCCFIEREKSVCGGVKSSVFVDALSIIYGFFKDRNKSDYLVVNNDPPAFDFDLLKLAALFPDAYIIFIDRDARDAYVDFAKDSVGSLGDLDLAKKYISRYNRGVRNARSAIGKSSKFISLRFEDFVSNGEVRESLVDTVFGRRMSRDKFNFDESQSINNVGKYRLFSQHQSVQYVFDNSISLMD